jgi:hypothetical protein
MSRLPVSLLAVSLPMLSACKMTLPPELASNATQMDVSTPLFGEDVHIGPFATAQFRTLSQGDERLAILVLKRRDSEKAFAFQLTRDGAPVRDVTCRAARNKASVIGIQTVDQEMRCVVGVPGGVAPAQLEMSDSTHGVLRSGADVLTVEQSSGVVGAVLRRQGQAVAAWQYSTPTTAWMATTADPETQATAAATIACSFVYQRFLADIDASHG